VQAFELPYRCKSGQLGAVTISSIKEETEPLDTRGWSLQERLLSPRLLEFATWQVRWMCQDSDVGTSDGWTADSRFTLRQNKLDSRVLQVNFGLVGHYLKRMRRDEIFDKAMKDWYSLVECYTSRILTQPTDRILAISGIAQRYGCVFHDQYVAGMWKGTLRSSLLWSVPEKNRRPRPTKYQGPSWSWTAVNSKVYFPYDIKVNTEGPDILEFRNIPEIEGNPYGIVREGFCRLVLKGKLLPGVLARKKTGISVSFLPMNDRGSFRESNVKLDTTDSEPEGHDLVRGEVIF
jgi:hypothetical protein